MTDEHLAIHEAGHTVVSLALGGKVRGVTIVPDAPGSPVRGSMTPATDCRMSRGEHRAAVFIAGVVAVGELLPNEDSTRFGMGDIDRLEALEADGVHLETGEALATEIVRENESSIRALAAALQKRRTLNEWDIAEVLKTAPLARIPWEVYHARAVLSLERAVS